MSSMNIETANRLIEYSIQGLSKVEAAKLIGVSDRQVLRILDKFNLREEYNDNLKKDKEQKILRNKPLLEKVKQQSIKWEEWHQELKINPDAVRPYKVFKFDVNYRIKAKNIFIGPKMKRVISDETRLKLSNSHKALWNDPIFREKQLSNRKLTSDETRQKLSENAKKLHKEGKLKSWATRPPSLQSYPEKVWERILIEKQLSYEREVKINKKDLGVKNDFSCYFLDYVIEANGTKIDLEIDGKQHKYPEIMKRDKVRDKLLTDHGYIVYRIDWVNPINEMNKRIFHNQIKDLLNFLETFKYSY